MKNQDFIITSLQPWDIEIGSTIKNTALEISKNNRVLYLNTPLDYSTWIRGGRDKSFIHRKKVILGRQPVLRQISENMWIVDCPFLAWPLNHLPGKWLFDFVNQLNNKKIATHILKYTNQLNFKNYIHLIDTDIYRSQYLKELIKPSLSIYYCRDFVIGKSYWKKNGTRLEPLLAAKSDMVLVNSSYFAERFIKYNNNTLSIETGVDLSLYNTKNDLPCPEDLKQIPHPIVGYVGAINSSRLDSDLLLYLAQQRLNYSFVFTGPEDEYFRQHDLHKQPNVFFTGKKMTKELPCYIAMFDVCINPQIVNNITEGNYPLKIDEYLAMGKPTVATSTHTMRDIFKNHVFLPSNKNEYVEALDSAILETTDLHLKKERINFAQTHSWENSVNKIYRFIKQYLQNQASPAI